MLESLGGVSEAVIVDLFAGSGSFGIECLSRGAERVVFVERNRTAARTLQDNLDSLGLGSDGAAEVIVGPVEGALGRLPQADIAFCDPPYADDPWSALLNAIRAELLVGHAERPVTLTERWEEVRRRDYGKARIVIARRVPDSQPSDGGDPGLGTENT